MATTDGELTLDAGAGTDLIVLTDVGAGARIDVSGGADADIMEVRGKGLPASIEVVDLHGNDPAGVPPDDGDLLRYNPEDPDPNDSFSNFIEMGTPNAGSRQVDESGPPLNGDVFGVLNFDTFEAVVDIAAPLIRFDGEPYETTEGSGITFITDITANGTGLVGDVEWDLDGDGAFDDAIGVSLALTWEQLVDFGINDDGTFRIGVTASNDLGTSAADTTLTVLNLLPVITVTTDSAVANVGRAFGIDIVAEDPGDDRIARWEILWGDEADPTQREEFGAGTVSATHVYKQPVAGTVTITATAFDEDGFGVGMATIGVIVAAGDFAIANSGPIAEGESVTFTTTFVGALGDAIVLDFDINGDELFNDANASVIVPAVAELDGDALRLLGITNDGTFEVQATGAYPNGSMVMATTTLVVTNTPPTAIAVVTPLLGDTDGIIAEGEGAVVTVTNQFDPSDADLATLRFSYDFNNDGDFDDDFEIELSAIATAEVPASLQIEDGLRTVRVVVSDDDDSTEIFADYLVANTPPELIVVPLDGQVDEGVFYELSLSATDVGTDTVQLWSVDWGDGTDPRTFVGAAVLASHAFVDDGDFTISVTAVDEDGAYDTTASVMVANVPPVLSALSATPTVENGFTTLTGNLFDQGVEDSFILNVDWGADFENTFNFPAGTNDFAVTHRYLDNSANDRYTISATVSDDDGGLGNTETTDVTVTNVAPAVTADVTTPVVGEGGLVELVGTIEDVGTLDGHTVFVNWGDGDNNNDDTVTEAVVDGRTFRATFNYVDDNPTDTPSDDYIITVPADDGDGGVGATTTSVTITNLAPVVTALTLTPPIINENDTVTLDGTFIDAGAADTHTVVIDWGDDRGADSISIATVDAITRTFTATHKYLDDNPSGTPSDQYEIAATVTDDDTGTVDASVFITVYNVAPTFVELTNSAAEVGQVLPGETVTLAAEIFDPGTLDTFDVTIGWGDGTPEDTLSLVAGESTFSFDHDYVDPGFFTITVVVVDDDLGELVGETEAKLTGVELGPDGVLRIAGTAGDDEVRILRRLEPIAYWNLNEISGPIIQDTAAGTPQDGTFFDNNTPELIHPGPPRSVAAYGAETGAQFHRTNQEHIAVAHGSVFAIPEGTIHLFFNAQSDAVNATLFSKDGSGAGAGDLTIAVNGRRIEVRMSDGTQTHSIVTDEIVVKQTWHQLALAFDDTGARLFYDGALVDSLAHTGGLSLNQRPIVIGGSIERNSSSDLSKLRVTDSFLGLIDEVSFFGHALGLDQLAQLRDTGPFGVTGVDGATAEVFASFLPLVGEDVIKKFSLPGEVVNEILIVLGDGNDVVHIDTSMDEPVTVNTGGGNDYVVASTGDTKVLAGAGNDTVFGGPGNDTLKGEDGDDFLLGGAGNDDIDGGPGTDSLSAPPVTPITYWTFDEIIGTLVADSAGSTTENGTFFGAGAPVLDEGPPDTVAPFGAEMAASFSGTPSEYVAVAHDEAFALNDGTVQFWFNARTTVGRQVLFAKDGEGLREGQLSISLDGDRIEATLEDGSDIDTVFENLFGLASYTIRTDMIVQWNTWYHLAFTFGRGGMKLYLDGNLVGVNGFGGGTRGNEEAIVIGGSNGTNTDASGDLSLLMISDPFDGLIDEVAVFGEALDQGQILEIIENGPSTVAASGSGAGLSGGLEDYTFAFVGDDLVVSDLRSIDGTDTYTEV